MGKQRLLACALLLQTVRTLVAQDVDQSVYESITSSSGTTSAPALLSAPPPPPVLPPARSKTEMAALKTKAAAGDGDAAYRLAMEYTLVYRDDAKAKSWMHRALKLGDPEAEIYAAHLLKDGDWNWIGYGLSRRHAVKPLLTRSARTNGEACFTLADHYAEGYFGKPDFVRARHYLEKGSELGESLVWDELSHYYRQGIGGPQDLCGAYRFKALQTACINPELLGRETTVGGPGGNRGMSFPGRAGSRVDPA